MSIQSDVEGRGQRPTADSERFGTVIIGGGQAGLSVGYHLAKRDRPFMILEANERIGTPGENAGTRCAFSKRLLTSRVQVFTPSTYTVNQWGKERTMRRASLTFVMVAVMLS